MPVGAHHLDRHGVVAPCFSEKLFGSDHDDGSEVGNQLFPGNEDQKAGDEASEQGQDRNADHPPEAG